MKKASLLSIFALAIVVSSCYPTFYQVYNVKPEYGIEYDERALVYEDQNCIITYNLWAENGNVGFIFYNKTEKDILLNMEKSFFVKNGIAYPYFKNRTITSTKSIGAARIDGGTMSVSVTGVNYFNLIQANKLSTSNEMNLSIGSGLSVSFEEERLINIPSKTSRVIVEHTINNELIRNCNLYRYPTKRKIESIFFNEETSPLKFYNRIVYSLENSLEPILVENHFFVSEIKNYPESEMLDSRYEQFCGEKSKTATIYTKHYAPYKFYIKYTKTDDTWEH